VDHFRSLYRGHPCVGHWRRKCHRYRNRRFRHDNGKLQRGQRHRDRCRTDGFDDQSLSTPKSGDHGSRNIPASCFQRWTDRSSLHSRVERYKCSRDVDFQQSFDRKLRIGIKWRCDFSRRGHCDHYSDRESPNRNSFHHRAVAGGNHTSAIDSRSSRNSRKIEITLLQGL